MTVGIRSQAETVQASEFRQQRRAISETARGTMLEDSIIGGDT